MAIGLHPDFVAGVAERMKPYMVDMGKSVPEEKELSEIIGFLQRHSGKQELSLKERDKP